jgi:FKBP-type peptidyl-prolyl cis-trans isomerase
MRIIGYLLLGAFVGAPPVGRADKPGAVDKKTHGKKNEKVENTEGQMVTTPSGLKYVDEKVGTGTQPEKGKKGTVHYTGTLVAN